MHRRTALVAAAATAVVAASLTGTSYAATSTDSSKLRQAVTVDSIRVHLAELERIADANQVDGVPTRATGTPGHEASVAYVKGVMTAAGFTVTEQPFTVELFEPVTPSAFEQTAPTPTVYPSGDEGDEDGVWYTASYSGNGDVTAKAYAVDVVAPTSTPSTSTSGCEATDFTGFPDGGIALLQRGTCDFGLKAENAQAAGADAVVLFNEGTLGEDNADRRDVLNPTLEGYDVDIPVIGTDYATGKSLVDLSRSTTGVTLRVKVDAQLRTVQTRNVIAESAAGRADRTVVVGGHLDSVPEGPGINDDGSGVSMMMATAQAMRATGFTPVNKVRFIFFSGEEEGLLGSDYYVSQLDKRGVKDIAAMLDYDMLASPNYGRFIYDGNGDEQGFAGPNGSGTIEQVYKDFWSSQGLAYETIPFDGRSDYDAFTTAGIPAGGIFAGAEDIKSAAQVGLYGGTAGVAFDKCYHQLCDDLTNINDTGLREHKDAAVHAIAVFAKTTSAVSGTGRSATVKKTEWKGNERVR